MPHLSCTLLFFLSFFFFNTTFAATPIRVEAETGTLSGVEVATSTTGFSGTGYVTGFDAETDQLRLAFNAPAGLYEISIGYRSPFGEKGVEFRLNDVRSSGTFRQTSTFSSHSLGKFLLKDGPQTLTIFRGWGYFDIDYILLTSATVQTPAKPAKTLSDPAATASARNLFSYLVDQYGTKVISGQQDDVEYILEKTGKEPAIGAFDLIDYSPTRVQNGAKPVRSSEACIDWAKKGDGRGIISLMWHWNAPTDLINQAPDKLWWSGFYTRATTFDLSAALADKNSERYQLLLRDIDAIAVQLKKFEAADVPVLWRPLHEAPGGWFWWGAKGPELFRQLWRLLYDRLTIHHRLHNLIWVYTGTDTVSPDWYPGDAYVDIVGLDIYTDPAATLSGPWEAALAQFNGKKLITLSEIGHLPRPENIRGLGTWWSWFAVWTGPDWIKKQPLDLLKAVFTDADVITRDELPDWRIPAAPVVTGVERPYEVCLLGNPATGGTAEVEIRNAQGLPLSIRLTDGQGRPLLERMVTPTGASARYALPLESAPGLYFIRVSSPKGADTLRIVKP
ncbi:glycosyl hydrolase [Tellurirhabdus rosea]|uniref:glycosyl hydrolase n=1 Tax=Tellurirhabdus rosea TaxID=2674997 RepID=UPI0022569DDF|nr:glycosyl hydrolase [Tellurirhabdus rosea]